MCYFRVDVILSMSSSLDSALNGMIEGPVNKKNQIKNKEETV